MASGAHPAEDQSEGTGTRSTTTTFQSFSLFGARSRRRNAARCPAIVAVPRATPSAAIRVKRSSCGCPRGAPTCCGLRLSTMTFPVALSTIVTSKPRAIEAASCWNEAIETSKWTIARAGRPVPGSGVELEITQVFVSGEMYGLAWKTCPRAQRERRCEEGILRLVRRELTDRRTDTGDEARVLGAAPVDEAHLADAGGIQLLDIRETVLRLPDAAGARANLGQPFARVAVERAKGGIVGSEQDRRARSLEVLLDLYSLVAGARREPLVGPALFLVPVAQAERSTPRQEKGAQTDCEKRDSTHCMIFGSPRTHDLPQTGGVSWSTLGEGPQLGLYPAAS